jgi:hypothetical protein
MYALAEHSQLTLFMKNTRSVLVLLVLGVVSISCTTINKTNTGISHPLMVGAYVAPGVKATEFELILKRYVEDNNSESSTVSGNNRISETSSSRGINGSLAVSEENDIIMVTDWIWISQTFYALGFNGQDRSLYTYFRKID